MKTSEEIMEILEAYDLTGGLRAAATMAGCDHKTVAHYVALHEAGHGAGGRPRLDELLPTICECVVAVLRQGGPPGSASVTST